MKTKLLAIAGASASGKTVLAKQLKADLESQGFKAAVIHEDAYYKSKLESLDGEPINYDHPDAFDYGLLRQHLKYILVDKPIYTPVYDYENHCRTEEVQVIDPVDVVILEGILVLHRPEIRYMFDLKVFVDTDLDVCLTRRIARDMKERGRTLDSILEQYNGTVRPMFQKFINPTKKFADIVLTDGRIDSKMIAWIESIKNNEDELDFSLITPVTS